MTKRMLINVKEAEESRIAIIDGDKLEEIYIERISSLGHVGNIYKGKVVNIEPSIQAAFVDIGEGRNGFLHVSDVMPVYGQMSNGNDLGRNRKREKKNPGFALKRSGSFSSNHQRRDWQQSSYSNNLSFYTREIRCLDALD